MYQINGEVYKIAKVEDITGLENLARGLVETGKETAIYHMERVIEGTRKKARTILCYRFKNSDKFITIL